METTFLHEVFSTEIMEYFEITDYQILCSVSDKLEYMLIAFDEKNVLPYGYSSSGYESKGFTLSSIVQDFPILWKGDYLRIRYEAVVISKQN